MRGTRYPSDGGRPARCLLRHRATGLRDPLVAEIVATFIRNYDAKRERCWIAVKDGRNVGSVFLVRHPEREGVAKLRLLQFEPEARGRGIGKRLVQECTRFARRARCHTITLWTNSVLAAARGIYEREGYRLVGEKPHESFGHDLIGHLGACAVNGTSDGPGTTGRTVDRVVVKTLGTRWTRSDVELAGPRQRADPSNMRAILIAAVALLLLAILLYNRLVSRRNQADYALASVDALLKKRHDLVPNLVATVRGYMTHERDVLERVTELRTRAHGLPIGTAARMDAEAGLAAALSGVLVRVEAYPELRASENVLQLQAALNEVEEQISAARRFFNAAVADYNNAIEMFPSSLVANTAGMKRRAFFEIPTVERATPRAALGD